MSYAGSSPDVLVVGGGAVGVSVALSLARRGAEVTLLESGSELGDGCSAGNAGLICPSHSTPIAAPAALRNGVRWLFKRNAPFRIKPSAKLGPWLARYVWASRVAQARRSKQLLRELNEVSLGLHAELFEEGVATGFERRGILNVYETEAGLAEASRELGPGSQLLDPPAARQLEPTLQGPFAGAVLHPDEGHCDPLAYVGAVGVAAAAAGARIETGARVRRVLAGEGGALKVETGTGTLRPAKLVIAAGASSQALLRSLGGYLPVQPGKGYSVDIEAPPVLPRMPVFLQERHLVATPLPGRLRLAGTLELGESSRAAAPARGEELRQAACSALPAAAGGRPRPVWSGLRPCSPDGVPIIGALPGRGDLWAATGHAMLGISLAPVTGEILADLIEGKDPVCDPRPLSPLRFRAGTKGRKVSQGQ